MKSINEIAPGIERYNKAFIDSVVDRMEEREANRERDAELARLAEITKECEKWFRLESKTKERVRV